ncbi:helix-turn-helix domain-containing protein [Streptomyces mirabilis]|uniref:helix-turn-helix domain-containing protein n=1 Tax=Streptomyces mirabilis TaxID=68239 RepID=UPI00367F7A89
MSFKVTNWVWSRSESRNGARLVMLALADRADDNGCAWPSIDDLAARTKLSPRAVQKGITSLVELGELEVENGGGRHRSNRYRIVPKPRTLDGVTDGKPRTSDGVSSQETPNFAPETPNFEAETPNFATRNPVQSSPEPLEEPSREPSGNHHNYPGAQQDRRPAVRGVEEDRLPEEITRLQDAMSGAGINLPWKFLGDDMIRVINDIKRLGIPLMVEQALKAEQGANPPPFSSRWFYDGWHKIRTPVAIGDGTADGANVRRLPSRSTADERVATGQALAAKFRAEEERAAIEAARINQEPA